MDADLDEANSEPDNSLVKNSERIRRSTRSSLALICGTSGAVFASLPALTQPRSICIKPRESE